MGNDDLSVSFYTRVPDGLPLRFVVIAARFCGSWVYVRHKERDTYEIPGGHIEPGEDPPVAAERELFEETGAVEFELFPVEVYSVTANGANSGGHLFFAEIRKLGNLPDYEMSERITLDGLPENLTYPKIQPLLFERVLKWLDARGGA